MYKKFFSKHLDATLLDRLFRRTSFLTHRGMLRLCGLYLSVGMEEKLSDSINETIYRVYQKKVHS